MTVQEASAHARCSDQTVYRLIKEGHIKAVNDGTAKKSQWRVTSTKAEVARAVAEHAPSSGYIKPTAAKHAATTKKSQPTNSVPEGLTQMLTFGQLAATTRTLLLRLAEKYDDPTLALLLELQ